MSFWLLKIVLFQAVVGAFAIDIARVQNVEESRIHKSCLNGNAITNPICEDLVGVEFLFNNDPKFRNSLPVKTFNHREKRYSEPKDEADLCPRNFSNTSYHNQFGNRGVPLRLRSLSPWRWVLNRNRRRIPRNILEAQCLCDHCVDYAIQREYFSHYSVLIQVVKEVEIWHQNGTLTKRMNVGIGCTCAAAHPSDNES